MRGGFIWFEILGCVEGNKVVGFVIIEQMGSVYFSCSFLFGLF